MIHLRVWDPGLRTWVLYASPKTVDEAKAKGRALWKQGAPGIQISESKTEVLVEHKRG